MSSAVALQVKQQGQPARVRPVLLTEQIARSPAFRWRPPLRWAGAEETMVWLFGDWNRPKPAPHSAIRQIISRSEGEEGNSARPKQAAGHHQQTNCPQ